MTATKKYEDGLPLGVIGIFNFREITNLQIMVPMGNRTQYEAILRDREGEIVVTRNNPNYQALRTGLAQEFHIGLMYTDLVLEKTLSFSRRLAAAESTRKPTALINQFTANGITYSIVHHPEQAFVQYNPEQDRIEPEFYRAVAQTTAEDPDNSLVFDDVTDTLFDAVVIIRNHIEKSIIKAFMPEVK